MMYTSTPLTPPSTCVGLIVSMGDYSWDCRNGLCILAWGRVLTLYSFRKLRKSLATNDLKRAARRPWKKIQEDSAMVAAAAAAMAMAVAPPMVASPHFVEWCQKTETTAPLSPTRCPEPTSWALPLWWLAGGAWASPAGRGSWELHYLNQETEWWQAYEGPGHLCGGTLMMEESKFKTLL